MAKELELLEFLSLPSHQVVKVLGFARQFSEIPVTSQLTAAVEKGEVEEYLSLLSEFKEILTRKLTKKAFANQEQPYQLHVLSDIELAKALQAGYKKVFGKEATAEALAGGWSQAVLESGRKLPNFNIGNIKATKDWILSGKPYFVKSTQENKANGESYIEHGTKWRAYESAEEGAAGYWELLKNKYGSSLDYMAAGDPSSAVVTLGKNHYFTANIKTYANGVSNLYKQFMEKLAPQLNLISAPVSPPGPKLELKDWAKDYQPEPSTPDSEMNATIKQLLATGPLTSLVKTAVMENSLPYQTLHIHIFGSDSLEFARNLSGFIDQSYQGFSQVGQSGDTITIKAQIPGSSQVVYEGIQETTDYYARKFNEKYASEIYGIATYLPPEEFTKIPAREIISNSNIFQLTKIGKHG